ncbi:GPP34 family phosphoprotein [uncultured Propionibacterium sp.]|uniref:GOLPH3/VPS74 family protein n=1 Tax=uncultured Propionibacterium sp. TaxID=218066 RepID=UPI002931846A|nr:GPP34 family phosphoprotein [uncultured Propionibacterium sp.]
MTTTVNLAAEFLLLVLDDEKGGFVRDLTTVNFTIAAAEIVELVAKGQLVFADGQKGTKVLAKGENGPSDEFFAYIIEAVEGKTYDQAISTLVGPFSPRPGPARSLRSYELQHLVEAGILRECHIKLLGLIPLTRYPEGDASTEIDLRARVRAVLGGAEPDERTRALVALLYASHSLTAVFPRLEARPMKRRAREIARRSWEDEGLAMALAEYFSYMAQLSAATMV